jgi:uncharacterized protein
MDPTAEFTGKLTGDQTRRSFIKAVAAAGASTMAAQALELAGVADLMTDSALAAGDATPFSEFRAIAASSLDRFEVPAGFRADVLIRYGDAFANTDGTVWTYGYNNDYLAYFPLDGEDEGLIFVNHEYPAPFFQNGYKQVGLENPPGKPAAKHTKTDAEIHAEIESVGNSIVHIKRGPDGVWGVVSPSKYNRRIYGGDVPGRPDTPLTFTGPLAGAPGTVRVPAVPGVAGATVAVGTTAPGTVGNCSGGITPWGTALSCEENYDGYGFPLGNQDFFYGWGQVAGDEYKADTAAQGESRRYGWVCEHDPYDKDFVGRKHTALGRFRHENTAFRQAAGKKFVLYMGDDQANQATYKFVSDRAFVKGDRENNLRILEQGTLYVAKWLPEGRRRYGAVNGSLLTATSGTGEWVEVADWELYDTRLTLAGYTTSVTAPRRAKQGSTPGDTDPADPAYAGRFNRDVDTGGGVLANEWLQYFAMNRPEDVEVDADGSVYIALTNNSGVNDVHGSVRKLVEAGNDPEATTFTWQDYASGGVSGRPAEGEQGFSSCDNLVFDSANNLWIVTDISSASLRGSASPAAHYDYHANNAVFMIPRSGPNAGVAFRFANMPVEAEGTGPYFTPDEQTLFVNVQHPGETTATRASSVFGEVDTYSSWWPTGDRTAGFRPATPIPATVAITRVRPPATPVAVPPSQTIPPGIPSAPGVPGSPKPDTSRPAVTRLALKKVSAAGFRRTGARVTFAISEPASVRIRLLARVGRRTVTVSTRTLKVGRVGTSTVTVRASSAGKALLRLRKRVPVTIEVRATDLAGNARTTKKQGRIG